MHPDTGKLFNFFPGKFLNTLIDYLVPNAQTGHTKPLSSEQAVKLHSLWWFDSWLQGVIASRSVGLTGVEPDANEKVELMCRTYIYTYGKHDVLKHGKRPVWGDCLGPRMVVRERGLTYKLNGFRLMEKLSSNWFAPEKSSAKVYHLDCGQKERIEALPWFLQWQKDGKQRRAVANMRKIVTKEQKLQLLCDHYSFNDDGTPRSKPNWADSIPVPHTAVCNENGEVVSVWNFKPATFIDDLVDNWVEGGRPGVTLTHEQKSQMNQLPWVAAWIAQVVATRKRKRAARSAPASDDDLEIPAPNGP